VIFHCPSPSVCAQPRPFNSRKSLPTFKALSPIVSPISFGLASFSASERYVRTL
jgi:hypothetical protein